MQVPNFYFAYGYKKGENDASELCRFLDSSFERFDKRHLGWVEDGELCCIFIGEDIYYDKITEKEALALIDKWRRTNAD